MPVRLTLTLRFDNIANPGKMHSQTIVELQHYPALTQPDECPVLGIVARRGIRHFDRYLLAPLITQRVRTVDADVCYCIFGR
jgi:hypothetical protein